MLFIYKFPNDHNNPRTNERLISRIKINGRFITFYVPKDKKDLFQPKYPEIFATRHLFRKNFNFGVLWKGDGFVHDIAHNAFNKGAFGFLSQHKTVHWHFVCDKEIDRPFLEKILKAINSADLNQQEKNAILNAYQSHLENPTLKDIISYIETYEKIVLILIGKNNDTNTQLIMPHQHIKTIFSQLENELNNALPDCGINEEPDFDVIDPNKSVYFSKYKATVNIKKFAETFYTALNFIGYLKEVKELLHHYLEKALTQEELLRALKEKMNKIKGNQVADFASILPLEPVKNEWGLNMPSGNVSQLYRFIIDTLAKELNDTSLLAFKVEPAIDTFSAITTVDDNKNSLCARLSSISHRT